MSAMHFYRSCVLISAYKIRERGEGKRMGHCAREQCSDHTRVDLSLALGILLHQGNFIFQRYNKEVLCLWWW